MIFDFTVATDILPCQDLSPPEPQYGNFQRRYFPKEYQIKRILASNEIMRQKKVMSELIVCQDSKIKITIIAGKKQGIYTAHGIIAAVMDIMTKAYVLRNFMNCSLINEVQFRYNPSEENLLISLEVEDKNQ